MQEQKMQTDPSPDKPLAELLAEAQAKLEQQRDAMMRAVADAENARKRAQTEAATAQKYALERANIREISPAKGERFDPHRHHAMAAVEARGCEPNTVVSLMQKGYMLHDRVLRPALVTVAKELESDDRNPISDIDLD